jgi:hypothetical protein
MAAPIVVVGLALQNTEHVHLDGGHVLHHSHPAIAPHSHAHDLAADGGPDRTPLHGADHRHAVSLSALIRHSASAQGSGSEHPSDAPSSPEPSPRMVWATLAFALAPLLPTPPEPVATGRAPPVVVVALPQVDARPLPYPRGPPA